MSAPPPIVDLPAPSVESSGPMTPKSNRRHEIPGSPQAVSSQPAQVYRVVLTGGPCGGKTSSLSVLRDRLQSQGWLVYSVPEAATTLFGGGISFGQLPPAGQYILQVELLKVMFALEDAFYKTAKSTGQKAVIICDRGAMDASAYMDAESWQKLLDENGWNQVLLRDGRYDCVIHLQTAADGAEQFYNSKTNVTRLESPEEARFLDRRCKEVWIGHPYLYMVDNSTDFYEKVGRVVEAVSKFIGAYEPGIIKRKFLVRRSTAPAGDAAFPVRHTDSVVKHDFVITDDGSQARLRSRGQGGQFTYTLTFRVKAPGDPTGVATTQLRRNISKFEYSMYLAQRDPALRSIEKSRRSFLYHNVNFELDTFFEPSDTAGLQLLEAYMPENSDPILPPFIDVEREVTSHPEFKLRNLAAGINNLQ